MHQTDDFPLGATGGTETVTLLNSEIAFHNHTANASAVPANQLAPDPTEVLATSQDGFAYQTNTSQDLVQMDPNALSITGSDLPHNNMQPYLTLLFCIALQGVFPPRG
jgi:microcystin-dependent protein